MDKSWMLSDRMSREYEIGVEKFIEFVILHSENPNLIRCPCQFCENLKFQSPRELENHLFVKVEMMHDAYKHCTVDPIAFKALLEDVEKPLFPGCPQQPRNNIDVYLAPLIEDLKTLWDVGVDAFDANKQ
ncbi:hypothetical protein Ddye_001229 [Dipteronia dyeriana]|uniref:Transposase-associated domain-containing protein n=1 Tax=Dipteronia dyeriana TaxID=168575 RepID=A0AAD9XNI0_9ROSI|nr:hypothetical protein Ddye_001229 [Dipteronia dyeriana]